MVSLAQIEVADAAPALAPAVEGALVTVLNKAEVITTGSKVMDLALAVRREIDSGRMDLVDMPLKHFFLPGIYIREIFMRRGAVVVGKIHKTRHFNIMQQGKLAYSDGNKLKYLTAPCTFVSEAGVQKALYILEDTVWSTVHLTDNRDMESLFTELVEPSEHYDLLPGEDEGKAIAIAAETEQHPVFLLEHK